jgi:hypothetical protein
MRCAKRKIGKEQLEWLVEVFKTLQDAKYRKLNIFCGPN